MRILQVIDSLRVGGAQKLMVTFAEQASARQVDVAVACLSNAEGMPLAPQITAGGAEVVSFPAGHLFSISRFMAFYRFVRAGKFDVLHSHLIYANILAWLAGWLCGIPVVASLHSTGQDKRHANFVRDNLELWCLRRVATVIAVGQSVRHAYQMLGSKLVYLPNAAGAGISLSASRRVDIRNQVVGSASRPILISVGRLSPDKCVDELLQGFALVLKQHPTTALVVAGDGVLRQKLEARANALGLSDNTFWLGMRSDIPELLAASDIYVSVSQREGMPVALLEAMAAGLPLVVTPVGDTPDLVGDDVGALVPVHQPAEFAEAVIRLLDNPDQCRQFGERARVRALDDFGAKQWFENLMQVYQRAGK